MCHTLHAHCILLCSQLSEAQRAEKREKQSCEPQTQNSESTGVLNFCYPFTHVDEKGVFIPDKLTTVFVSVCVSVHAHCP